MKKYNCTLKTYNGKTLQSGSYIWKLQARFKDGSEQFGNSDKPEEFGNLGNIVLIK